MKIAFSGTHGTGKSFAAGSRYMEEKQKNPNKSVVVLSENVRMCPFDINKASTKYSQFWIFSDQMKQELEYQSKYEIVICDRSIVDCISYAASTFNDEKFINSLIEVASEYIHTYDEIIFKTVKNNDFWYADDIRETTDLDFRMKVEEELLKIYERIISKSNSKINFKVV